MWLGGIGGAPGDRKQRQAFARALRLEADRRRWPELLIYGPDEPAATGDRAEAAHETFAQLDHFRPTLRIVTAITPEAVWVYANELDVWVVHSTRHVDQYMHQLAADHGAELWSYDCAHRGTNPTWNRYYAGLYTWAHRIKGNFLWCYTDLEAPERYYTYEANRDAFWSQVLPSRFGPLPSVGWEARREGIEDYRYLRELERLCRTAPGPGPGADQARQWLDELRQRVLDNVRINRIEMPDFGPLYHWDWADLWTECPLIESDDFRKIRNRAVNFLLELRW